jgi:O-antigen/teichoic acid export membrane protein
VGNPIKKLAGQTAIYGLSSIVGRFLNYLLTPYWIKFGEFSTDQFGVITEMYAYVAFLVVFLTYGMETTYFRYSSKKGYDSKNIYSTILPTIIFSSISFILVSSFFSQGIANWLIYPGHSEYVIWFAVIVGFDAITSIPLAYLRKQNRARKFAAVNLGNVTVNIGLNLFFIGYCKTRFEAGSTNWLIDLVYNPEIGVGYVFIANLIASIFKLLVVIPEIYLIRAGKFVRSYLKPFFKYSIPLLFVGLAGIVNETLDRVLLKRLLVSDVGLDEAMSQLGIYGANYKLSILITLFIQAYRYAAEPFFFSQEKEKNSKEMYSKIMNYFVLVVPFFSCWLQGILTYLSILSQTKTSGLD